jgi:hypothetical protein
MQYTTGRQQYAAHESNPMIGCVPGAVIWPIAADADIIPTPIAKTNRFMASS